MADELVDHLAIFWCRFPSMVAAHSCSFWSENYIRMKEFVRLSSYVPIHHLPFICLGRSCVVSSLRVFLLLFMARSVPTFVIHLQEFGAPVGACLPAPLAYAFLLPFFAGGFHSCLCNTSQY
jgi:hypothetical protein